MVELPTLGGDEDPQTIKRHKRIDTGLQIDFSFAFRVSCQEGKDSFGQEAVDTLIKEIEDKRDQVGIGVGKCWRGVKMLPSLKLT